MPDLLLDVGNSALKWALLPAGGTLGPVTSVAYRRSDEPFDAAVDVSAAQASVSDALRSVGNVDRALGCSVAAEALTAALEAAVGSRCGRAPRWLRAQPAFDDGHVRLTNGYRNPEQLGADRWHAMLGARALYPDTALVVVQAGTATTLDAIDATGRFMGGEILPGWQMMTASLARGTGRLPLARGAVTAFADNTLDAIASGVADAQAGAVERFVRRFAHQQPALRVVFTGGAAPALHAALRSFTTEGAVLPPSAIQDNLVLTGLAHRARAA
jgi:type III pantothenate kinase